MAEIATRIVSDCPRCCGVKTVFFGICDVCFAEFDEWRPPEFATVDADDATKPAGVADDDGDVARLATGAPAR